MATYYARKAGDINAVDVWAATPTGAASNLFPTFTNADVLMANSFTITVNVNTTVAELRNDTTGGATAGGTFSLANGVTLTANPFGGAASTNCVAFSLPSPNTASIVGNCLGGALSSAVAVNITSTGTLNVTGNCSGGSGAGASAVSLSSGILNVTGNATGGSATSTAGINVTGSGVLNLTGNSTGGSGTTAFGVNNVSTGAVTIIGTIFASEFSAGVGGTNRNQVTLLTGPFISSASFGVSAVANLAWRWAASLNNQTYIRVPTNDLLAARNLVTPDNATNFPAASNVRLGTTYGIGGAVTGTCAVPPAASVGIGVPVGNTTGAAILTAADIWNTLTNTMNTVGSVGERLKNCSTVATSGSQLAAAITPP